MKSRTKGMFSAAVVALATLVAPVAPAAHAGPADAAARCAANQVPDIDTTISVFGNGGGSFPAEAVPANTLEPGDVFYLVALSPQVYTGFTHVGPGGTGGTAPASFPYPGLPAYSAVVRFNNNPGGWVGAPVPATNLVDRCMTWTQSAPVRLLFGVNDDNLSDNSGYWHFQVLVHKANARTTGSVDRCHRGLAPSQTISVRGNGGGSFPAGPNPPNTITDGDTFSVWWIRYSNVSFGFGGPSFGAYGDNRAAPPNWPYPGMFQYSAVLRFNNDPTGWVNAPAHAAAFGGCHLWSGPPVRLLFGVNDTTTWDNTGSWDFYVRVYKP